MTQDGEQQNEHHSDHLRQRNSGKHLVLSAEDRLIEVYLLMHVPVTSMLVLGLSTPAGTPGVAAGVNFTARVTGSRHPPADRNVCLNASHPSCRRYITNCCY
jgi:hypothetical protein